ncbi:(2Fe-2S) ferredoxin domain-containing protein [Microcoleus sp. FACHB-1515]|uniref:(2Fe-2S) ferredoxin domain-containing protein n=1 Tax=Cyanophyceae TaxID=3028117 RepID=UPI001684D824|nr:NAD(P)H-dependent oxidoreductase subunit E [Microcoleus sp. FACHB-1515]MBD2089230.1 (2Fe-2S) ferredoxin domain-containing protein [Microcoleus sp. FACHB-1515]
MACKTVLVCQNRTCRRQGAAQVLQAFSAQVDAAIEVRSSSCLGQCGNGPMVLVLPDQVWYSAVQPIEVTIVVDRHLHHDQPVCNLLYRKFHPPSL